MERVIFARQLGKQSIADRIVDQKQVQSVVTKDEMYNLLLFDETKEVEFCLENSPAIAEKCREDAVLASVCETMGHLLALAPQPHESLLGDSVDVPLNEAEKEAAARAYHQDLRYLRGFSSISSSYLNDYGKYSRPGSSWMPSVSSSGSSLSSSSPFNATVAPRSFSDHHQNVYGPNFQPKSSTLHGFGRWILHTAIQLPSLTTNGITVTLQAGDLVDLFKDFQTGRLIVKSTMFRDELDGTGSALDAMPQHRISAQVAMPFASRSAPTVAPPNLLQKHHFSPYTGAAGHQTAPPGAGRQNPAQFRSNSNQQTNMIDLTGVARQRPAGANPNSGAAKSIEIIELD